ncbi:hypothetical protein Patl1_21808 [Pistacia atlantica]|uniref:Uncharacterized protein n=1 Tax=Pistacia atlantica TaxID=434234 RepID=A0ACC1BI20_9ROSI|nr:hypothetical protein Patl1_21808 [Pistacia atlantica]
MASHHHNHHQMTTTSSCCCCSNACSHHPAPPPPSSTDPLLQTILSHLLQQQQQQQQSPQQPHYQNLSHNQTHKNHHFHHQNQSFQHQNCNFQHQEEYPQAKLVLSSLISRIDALETSLQNFSLSSATYNQYSSSSSCSLRDVAARVIQTHFRAFLVRRSRTLRQLKELALIKSSFNSLKLSVSKKTHLDFHLVSRKAMDLLLKLDSIQGDDPMIRDGKRSISMDLVKFLEFVDGFAVRRNEISCKGSKNVRLVRHDGNKSRFLRSNSGDSSKDQIDLMKKLRERVDRINGYSRVSKTEDEVVELEGFHQFIDDEELENPRVYRNKNGVLVKEHIVAQPKVKKSVSFAENGNVYRIFSNDNSHEPNSSGDGTLTDESVSSDDNGIILENICTKVEGSKGLSEVTEDGEELYLENGGSVQSSDEERKPRMSLRSEDTDEIIGDYIGQDGHFVFSAPLPLKMESRIDLMKKRKAVKIVA